MRRQESARHELLARVCPVSSMLLSIGGGSLRKGRILLGYLPLCVVRMVMRVKRLKGIWWMPWRREAMKDVVRCEKPRGAANKL